MKSLNYQLEQIVLPRKLRSECFDLMSEEDFNPDVVDCYGLDMFDAGCDTGLVFGIFCGSVLTLSGLAIKKLVAWVKAKKNKNLKDDKA